MEQLPKDVIFNIALTMDLPEILTYCQLSQRHNDIVCNNDYFWSIRTKRDYGINIKGKNLKDVYKSVKRIKENEKYSEIDIKLKKNHNEYIRINKSNNDLTVYYTLTTNFGEILLDSSKTETYKYLSGKYYLYQEGGVVINGKAEQMKKFRLSSFKDVVTSINDLTEMGYEYSKNGYLF